MATPQAVIFDLGKVLLDFDYEIMVMRVAVRCRVSPREILKAIDQSQLLHRYETGLMTTDEFFQETRGLIGYEGTQREFEVAFGDVFSEIHDMVDWQARLRAAGIPTFIFSNTNELAVRHIWQRFEFFGGFDAYIYSYEHGAMKPDARLYEVVEEWSGFSGDELFYLDDRLENVQAGEARGWQVFHHSIPAKSLAAAAAAGLPA